VKIRSGFVSNSSSSSFIVIGEILKRKDITENLIATGKVYFRGTCLAEGFDFFQVTQEIFKYAQKNELFDKEDEEYTWIYVESKSEDPIPLKDFKDMYTDNMVALQIEGDRRSTDNLEIFKQRYDPNY